MKQAVIEKSLMIVDDSMIMRNRIARLVTDSRLPPMRIVALARDGEQAVTLASKERPQLVTMDLTMPRLDGAQCIKIIAGLLPESRILVISALSDKATALKALKEGAHGFLHKPFTDLALIHALIELLK